jgi:hypothetical protein
VPDGGRMVRRRLRRSRRALRRSLAGAPEVPPAPVALRRSRLGRRGRPGSLEGPTEEGTRGRRLRHRRRRRSGSPSRGGGHRHHRCPLRLDADRDEARARGPETERADGHRRPPRRRTVVRRSERRHPARRRAELPREREPPLPASVHGEGRQMVREGPIVAGDDQSAMHLVHQRPRQAGAAPVGDARAAVVPRDDLPARERALAAAERARPVQDRTPSVVAHSSA